MKSYYILQTVNERSAQNTLNESKAKLQKCKSCGGMLEEINFCTECKLAIFVKCTTCDKKEYADLHEFCYCQLDVLTTI